MPLGEFMAETVAQLAMEAGGEAIKERYGCKGCVVALLIVAGIITSVVWYLTR